MNKLTVIAEIDALAARLNQQLEDVQGTRSVHTDVVKMVVPMQLDMLELMRKIVDYSESVGEDETISAIRGSSGLDDLQNAQPGKLG